MEVLSLFALAAAPGAAIALYLYWNDEHEKEPTRLIRKSFLFGLGSILVTLILSPVMTGIIGIDPERASSGGYGLFSMALFTFVGVGLVEEFSKWIMVRVKILNWQNFNEPYDGILYSVMVSLGFATLENVLYIFGAQEAAPYGGWITGGIRMFTAVPAHAICGVLMGYYYGKAKFQGHGRGTNLALALIVPTIFHGAYDFFAFLDYTPGILAGAFISIIVGSLLASRAMKEHKNNSPFHPDRIPAETQDVL